jgi:Bacterial Ig domain/Divergent InlB B-repeat domain
VTYRRILLLTLLGCLLAAAPASAQTLTVSKTPHGGTVTSSPGGISCGADCSQSYPFQEECFENPLPGKPDICFDVPQHVTLTAASSNGFNFTGWSSCDSGTGSSCGVTMENSRTVTASFTDVTNPVATLTGPAAGSKRGTIDLTANASDNWGVKRVEFLLGSSVVATDTSAPYAATLNTTTKADGVYTVRARAIDNADRSDDSTSLSIRIDNTAPSMDVDGPDGQAFGPGSTQTWTLDLDGGVSGLASVRCSVVPEGSPAAFGPCSGGDESHSVTGRPAGEHVLAVKATDGAGNVRTVEREFTIDATAPQTTITSGPAEGSSSTATTATFGLAAEPGATFRCRVYPAALTPPAFGSCSAAASHTAGGFAPGTYSFEAVATDAVGNVDPTPAKRTFTVLATTTTTTTTKTTEHDPGGGDDALRSLDIGLSHLWAVSGGRSRVLKLTVKRLPKGAEVEVRCKGRGCGFKRKTLTADGSKLKLKKLFGRRKLRAGARVEVRVTAAGHIGKVFRYTARTGRRVPKSRTLCLALGATKPASC